MKQAGNFLFNVMQYVVGWRFECRILSNIYIYISGNHFETFDILSFLIFSTNEHILVLTKGRLFH